MRQNNSLAQALDQFMQAVLDTLNVSAAHPQNMFMIADDEQWQSPCIQTDADDNGEVAWIPVLQPFPAEFDNVEDAVQFSLHPDIKTFYSRYFSDPLYACSPRGNLQLLQVWNEDDVERLQANLIGHILMKQKLRQPITLFFALTDEEDFILTIDNDSGEVLLEQVGREAQEVLAADLATFIASLKPQLLD